MKTLPCTLILLVLLSLIPLSCKSPASLSKTAQPNQVLFQDDFSNPSSGWNRVTETNGVSDYDDGVYRILVDAPNTDIWAQPGLNFTDVRTEVDALKVGGDRDNRFGIICRINHNDSFYAFVISSDGYYGIGKIKGEQYTLLGMKALQPSEKIQQGSASNHIRADCVGDTLTMYVNGDKLAEAKDNEFTSGGVGLIAGTYKNPGTDIRFDNFSVLKP